MVAGSLWQLEAVDLSGDLINLFKPVETLLHNYNSRIGISLNLVNRNKRLIKNAIIEIILESMSERLEWKLRVNGIGVTKEFKPHISLKLGNRWLHKFIFDISSLLNVQHALSREWFNVNIKYEGGDPFSVKALVFNAIYEDGDASTSIKHLTGLLRLNLGENIEVHIPDYIRSDIYDMRMILEIPRDGRIKLIVGDNETEILSNSHGFDEYVYTVNRAHTENKIRLVYQNSRSPREIPMVVSSIMMFRTRIKQPRLEIRDLEIVRKENDIWLRLYIVNTGSSIPDRVIYSVFHRGQVICSFRENIPIKPGEELVKEIYVKGNIRDDITVRVIWSKLTRIWTTERSVKIL
ncbi:MAG: hypothetical protein QW551_02895 [Desulfurococcaceae archaeon]